MHTPACYPIFLWLGPIERVHSLNKQELTACWSETEMGARGQKLNANFFFSNFSGTAGISQQIPGISRQKICFPCFRGTYRTFWPPPLHVEDPHPTGKYPDQKVWVWVPFSLLSKELRRRRAEKRLSKRVFLESPFLLCSVKVFRTFQVF